ncbi:MAG: glutathione S-transferase family protein [Burkholderiaceae bacterium]
MGLLVDGRWQDRWYDTEGNEGRFVRTQATWRGAITADASPGPDGRVFAPEAGRYHLYVSYACPWAHRTLIARALKGLESLIGISVVHWLMAEHGWTFNPDSDGVVGDNLYGSELLYQLYQRADPAFTGRVTVPVLWDTRSQTIVSNESSEIIRMFNQAFAPLGVAGPDLYPEPLRAGIDQWNARIYDTLNNGVYRAGFATTQAAYDEAVGPLFETMDALEAHLGAHRYLVGPAPTEADWRLLPTLLRFDPVYHGHFKCNLRRLVDYPNLWAYTRELYQWPGVAGTCRLEHARRHYYQSHRMINPSGIVPLGPRLDLDAPTGASGSIERSTIVGEIFLGAPDDWRARPARCRLTGRTSPSNKRLARPGDPQWPI